MAGKYRELRNLVESLVVLMGRRNTVTMADLPQEFLSSIGAGQSTNTGSVLTKLEGAERDAVKTTIYACRGNLTQAAEKLGIAKSTLYQKIKEYGPRSSANARVGRPTGAAPSFLRKSLNTPKSNRSIFRIYMTPRRPPGPCDILRRGCQQVSRVR